MHATRSLPGRLTNMARGLMMLGSAVAFAGVAASGGSDWVSTHTRAWPTLAKVQYLGAAAPETPLRIAVALRMHKSAGLKSFIQQVHSKRMVIPPR